MLMLVDCTNCRTPLQLPPGAHSIRCAVCQAVTRIAEQPRSAQPPSPPPPSASSSHQYYPQQPRPPSPYNHAPPGQPPSVHGHKRAVICGISYRYSRHELKGCINDAKCMKYLLINRFKFPESSILMLTEEEIDPYRLPTRHNIRMAMNWLVQGCQPGDSLVFHYSGHGSQQRNYTGDEITGYDETLCPLDFETQGMIIDSEINATIVRPLPRGVKLHAIIDACHSGTVLDLAVLCRMDRLLFPAGSARLKQGSPFSPPTSPLKVQRVYSGEKHPHTQLSQKTIHLFFARVVWGCKSGRYAWEDHRPRNGVWKGTSGGEAISFSGCDDDQTSADTAALSHVTSTGAMTFSFIQAIEQGQATTYGNILTHIRSTIRDADNNTGVGGGVVTSLLTMLLTGGSLGSGMRQEPQLTANEAFDVYSKPFSL